MDKKIRVLAIIPAKTDSTRLPKKNLRKINDKTLIEHSIEFAMNRSDKYEVDIIVSTESQEVKDIVSKYDVLIHNRLRIQLGDAEVTDVYRNVLSGHYSANGDCAEYDYVMGLQPDHPDRQHKFDMYMDYIINNNYDDLITIEPSYRRSGSVRIFKAKMLEFDRVSKRIGTLVDDATDIHYQEDLDKAAKNMSKESKPPNTLKQI